MATNLLILLCKNCLRSCILGYFLAHSWHNFTNAIHNCLHILYLLCAHPVLISTANLKWLQGRSHLSSESTMLLRKAVED